MLTDLLIALIVFVVLGCGWLLFVHGSEDRSDISDRLTRDTRWKEGERWTPLVESSYETDIIDAKVKLDTTDIDYFVDWDPLRTQGAISLLNHRIYVPESDYPQARDELHNTESEKILQPPPQTR